MELRRTVGPIHPKELESGEMEPHFQEADGQNRQCRQKLLELKAQKEN